MELAGGLTLVGGGDYSSGMFGMDFSQPPYRFPDGAFQLDITFTFKKSVFFADYVIICLGKGITSTESSPNITQVHSFIGLFVCLLVSLNFHAKLNKKLFYLTFIILPYNKTSLGSQITDVMML